MDREESRKRFPGKRMARSREALSRQWAAQKIPKHPPPAPNAVARAKMGRETPGNQRSRTHRASLIDCPAWPAWAADKPPVIKLRLEGMRSACLKCPTMEKVL